MRAILVVLGLLVAGFIGLGFYLNWFNLTVDREKMGADVNSVKGKLEGKSPGAKGEVEGTVRKVEADENRFTLKTADDPERTVLMTDASKVWRGQDTGKFADLKAGDKVTVTFREKGEKNEASSVTVHPK